MNINMLEARKIIIRMVGNNPTGVHYGRLDTIIVSKMPDMIIGGYGNKLKPLLDEMVREGILSDKNSHYTKGSNFPESF